MTGLSVLLQSNTLRQALSPYVLGGAHGKLLDADHDRLGTADVQCFEMEELMHSKAAVMAVLHYLFARFDERFDGAPTLLILDEAWLFLDDPVFAARIRQWLKTLRKKNVSVIFATQSLADIRIRASHPRSSKAARVGFSCPTRRRPSRRFARSTRASASTGGRSKSSPPRSQARLLLPIPPRQPPVRPRPGAGGAGLRGRFTPQDQRDIDRVLLDAGVPGFAGAWLRHRGLDWAADLLPSFPGLAPGSLMTNPWRTCHEKRLIAAAIAAMLCTATAHAQWVVVDPRTSCRTR